MFAVMVLSIFAQNDMDQLICTAEFAPVCANGSTFSNKCQASNAGFQTTTDGACEPQIPLTNLTNGTQIPVNHSHWNSTHNLTGNYSNTTNCSSSPVCFKNVQYDSECQAIEKNITGYANGSCTLTRSSESHYSIGYIFLPLTFLISLF